MTPYNSHQHLYLTWAKYNVCYGIQIGIGAYEIYFIIYIEITSLHNFPVNFDQLFKPCSYWIKSMLPLHQSLGHSGKVVTLSPPTSEAGIRFPARPQVGKLVVACRWSAVYSTDL